MNAHEALLAAAPLAADTAEDGIAALVATTCQLPSAIHAAIVAALAAGLIRDPIRLEPGALHCRWVLELTPSGRDAARRLTGD